MTGEITLYCDDAIRVLGELAPGSVDAAVFDPPYPTISGGSNDREGGKHTRPSGILTKNDGKIFAHNSISPDQFLPAIHRVLRDDAHVYMMTNVFNLVENGVIDALRRNGFQVHNLLFWRKNNATPNRWYMKDVELTIFARKGKAFSINRPGTRSTLSVDPHPRDDMSIWGDFEFPYALDHDNVSSPKSHPTEKPVNLMRTYIENSTQPGELVLDPFMGTGATGVAAADTGRRFAGIEVDQTYCNAAARRMGTTLRCRRADPLDGFLDGAPSDLIDAFLG